MKPNKFLFIIILCFSNAFSGSKDVINTPSLIAAPSTSYPISYTINAGRASLVKISSKQFNLKLYEVHENISMSSSEHSELVNINDFIDLWNKKKNIRVNADITGVQVDNKIFGHTQFYATVLLTDINYNKNSHILFFKFITIHPFIKMKNHQANFINATVFINGCDINNCDEEKP